MQGIDHIPVANALGGWPTEGSLAVEGVEHYAFEQVTQGHVVIFGEGLENFEKTFFHADAGLNALDKELRFIDHGTNVPWYICNDNRCVPLHAGDAASRVSTGHSSMRKSKTA